MDQVEEAIPHVAKLGKAIDDEEMMQKKPIDALDLNVAVHKNQKKSNF